MLSRAQRALAASLENFTFECIGSNQTDDEIVIADSLRQFGHLISAIEDERDRMVFFCNHFQVLTFYTIRTVVANLNLTLLKLFYRTTEII